MSDSESESQYHLCSVFTVRHPRVVSKTGSKYLVNDKICVSCVIPGGTFCLKRNGSYTGKLKVFMRLSGHKSEELELIHSLNGKL